ncbi:ca812b85-e0fc-4ae4-a3a6-ab2cbf157aef [Sclerotinia trifoliorum]|uniref:Ca812b85-e0fc-4ae4-a3a6-ab2cbf157aef n=1 Tax=Sclerotinia trifoliorum TaxID=28548 RepID=A0A8H2VSQ9_9HELO|nr:ca812b85-e0fc-4ae4-a3a6-ab2cbf157aef [Sclerotinia trifoliorum]
MPPLIVPKPGDMPPLRLSINQRLSGTWEDDQGNYLIRDFSAEEKAEYELINQLTEASSSHRLGAQSTIEKEDRVLFEFKRDMIFRYRMMGRELPSTDMDDPVFEKLLFNQDAETLRKDIIFYIQLWMRRVVPRRLTDTQPKISSATHRRTQLEKWILDKRDAPLFTRKKGQYLRWQDIVITRASRTHEEMESSDSQTPNIGKFNMVVTFPYLKTNGEKDMETGKEAKVLRMTLNYVQNPENIALSPTLRALGIMLRRGVRNLCFIMKTGSG